ncbi:ATP-binding cassette domain-containing protein [Sphingomonas sp. ST-64]|uniref:ATP-binding cassette domain-containing protein n=1 Tax=Sphingomonas plantiphila TaxID=3163295 RepID=A0ABW8YKT7_9SPHN
MRTRERSGGWWLVDIAGAGLFAWGLAAAIGGLVDGTGLASHAVVTMLAGGAVRGGSVWAAQARAAAGAQRKVAPLRVALHRRLLAGALPRAVPIGESAAIAIDHADRIEAHAARFLPVRLAATAGPLLVAILVAFASPVAAAILVATLVPFVLGMILAGTMARRAADAQLRALEQLSELFVERLRALAIIRHFGAGDRITRQVGAATAATAQRTLSVLRVAFLSSAILEFFAALSVALVAVYCGFALLGILPFPVPETLTFREALFALAMAPEFYLPMRRLAAAYHEKQLGEAAHAVIDPLLADPPPAVAPPPYAGLTAEALEIAWPGARIGPVSFALGRTGMVALTGPTGSGKTSLLAACAGQVATAGGSVVAIDPADIAWAAQRPLILPGSLRDNLTLARPDAGDAEVVEVCHRVGLDRLLVTRAEGLDLALDHHGSGLSGGERRRLALARALLSSRPLLLCDEPTADLDAASAAHITALLRDIARTHAVLVATHDQALAAVADRVVAL